MYQSQKSNLFDHFFVSICSLIKNRRENMTFEWYGKVFIRWVPANPGKSIVYLSLWKWKNITSDTRYQKYLRYAKLQQSSRKWAKNGEKKHQNSHFSTLWRQSDFGHYFFQYFSLAEPSNWLLVDLKKKKIKKSKNFRKSTKFSMKFFWTFVTGQKRLPEPCWMALVCCFDLIFDYQT